MSSLLTQQPETCTSDSIIKNAQKGSNLDNGRREPDTGIRPRANPKVCGSNPGHVVRRDEANERASAAIERLGVVIRLCVEEEAETAIPAVWHAFHVSKNIVGRPGKKFFNAISS